MTVKKLNSAGKSEVLKMYFSKEYTLTEIAFMLEVSRRTVGRVIIEAGLATPVPRLQGEAYQAMKILNKYDISVSKLEDLLKGYVYEKYEAMSQTYIQAA